MSGKRILALTTDSYGGRGGIAVYARDTIAAMAARDDVAQVTVLASLVPDAVADLPAKVRFVDRSRHGKAGYALAAVRLGLGRCDAVWTSHCALAGLALGAARRSGAKLGVSLHGGEVWQVGKAFNEWALRRADLLMPVSQLTLDRHLAVRGEGPREHLILPGAVDLERFTPGAKPHGLLDRYGLGGRKVLLSMARMGEDHDLKGFARVLGAMPALLTDTPDLVYVMSGDGPARPMLEQAVAAAGLQHAVRFTGYVAEEEKADHYRLADAFILASLGEGLGIVFLEAQACGIPTIASDLDGGREAVAGMGWAIDPLDPGAIREAVSAALSRPRARPGGIEHFSMRRFDARMNDAVDRLLA